MMYGLRVKLISAMSEINSSMANTTCSHPEARCNTHILTMEYTGHLLNSDQGV